RVRLQHVRADLAAPIGRPQLTALLRLLFFLFADPLFEQASTQDPHRGLLVLQLRTLVLARDDDARREVRNTHRGLGLVHVLTARAGPADPGRDRDDRVALVVRAGELRLEARACDLRAELGELRRDLRLERRILARERGELGDVLRARSKPIPPLEARAEVAEALE